MEHLTQSEMIGYRQHQLPAPILLAIDDHIAGCESCCRKVARCAPAADAAEVFAALGDPHLAYEQIEAYVEERSAPAERTRVVSHLEICPQCRAEADDLARFSKESRQWSPTPRRRAPFSWRLPALAACLTAAAVLTAIVWWPASKRPTIDPETADTTFEIPATVAALRGTRTIVRAPAAEASFDILHPIATAVVGDRPQFGWKSLAESAEYQVAVFTDSFRKVAESPWLESTEWTPSEPLERGPIYSWQVTARRKNTTVRAPAVTDPEAKFLVIDAAQTAAIEQARQAKPGSHLLLGILYARAGVVDEAEREFAAHAAAHPQSRQAAALLEKIRAARR